MEIVACIDPKTGRPYCKTGKCCCKGFFVILTKGDLRRLGSRFDIEKVTTSESGVRLMKHEDGHCVFLDPVKRTCTIHDAKTPEGESIQPMECRMFPLMWKDGEFRVSERCPGEKKRASKREEEIIKKFYQQYDDEL